MIKDEFPVLYPKTWYGMPAYQLDGKNLVFSRARNGLVQGIAHWVSAIQQNWTRDYSGRLLMRWLRWMQL